MRISDWSSDVCSSDLNLAIPIGQGQTLSQPQVVALMTQALRASRRTKVLEVGTGSGYQAAVLSRICRRVYTIERFKELLQTAEARFLQLRLHNITTRHGDGWTGWREQIGSASCRERVCQYG